MRILFISNNASLGGAPRVLLNLCREMTVLGHEIGVILPAVGGPLKADMEALGVRCFCEMDYRLTIWPGKVNPVKYASRLRWLRRELPKVRTYVGKVIDEFRPDIVHTNVGPLDLALDECRRRGIPHVWHLREYQKPDFGMDFYPSGKAFLEKIHSEGNWSVAITPDLGAYWNIRPEDRVIFDGVFSEADTARKPEASKEFGRYFLYAARIERAKGLALLLRAFRRFSRQGEDVRLVVAGRPCGLYALRCKLYAKIFLPGKVVFTGVRSDVAELMAGALATVAASRCEGFGLTVAEAMLAGCPLIGRETSGIKAQLDNGLHDTGKEIGLRFSSCGELAAALQTAARGGLDEMTERARQVVTGRYSARESAAQILDYYKDILSR